jgi:UDP-N-acetylmuramate--alanine ligase
VKFTYTEDGVYITPPSRSLPRGTTLVVYSLAVDDTSAELSDARSRAIPLVSRAQLLGALMSEYRVRISVSGSHGKSTTTAAIEHVLSSLGRAHTSVSGALFDTGRAYTDLGGDIFLAEACEYKDSFLRLCPTHQIVTSIELDHTDYFASLDGVLSSFRRAADMASTVIVNRDDATASANSRSSTGSNWVGRA